MTVEIPEGWGEDPTVLTRYSDEELIKDIAWYRESIPLLEQKNEEKARLVAAILRDRLSNRQEELRRREKCQTKLEVKHKPKPKPKTEAEPEHMSNDIDKKIEENEIRRREASRTQPKLKPKPFFPREVIDRVKQQASVLDYFSDRFGAPRKQGDTYVASCPFPSHQDRNISFTVYPDTNRWFCVECRKGGDVIDLVRELHGLGFVEGIEHLVAMAAESVSPPEGTKMRGEMARPRIAIGDGRRPGWYWASHEIIDIYGAKMGPHGLAIYHALCRHANEKGESWPSYATLAKETGMSRKQAINTMKRLVELELVGKQDRNDKVGAPTSNLYTLLEVQGGRERRTLPVGNDVPQGREPGSPKGQSLKKKPFEKEPTNTNAVQASLFDESTDRRKEDIDSSLSDKEKVLRDFGVRGPVVTQIAKSHDLTWIEAAIMQMREPGGVVHLHREGWEPVLDEDDTKTPIYCSECGDLEDICGCPDPKPRRVVHSELTTLQERRRADALRRAADPGLDRVQPFFDVYKRFPDPYELLEFEAGLREP